MKKDKKMIDIIITVVLIALVVAMIVFTATTETSSQEVLSIELYKSGDASSRNHYYIYKNTNTIKIRNFTSDGSNNAVRKEISQDLIDNFKNALEEYIAQKPTINSSFYMNERYTIEFEGSSIIVPDPEVVTNLGFDGTPFTSFYNTIEKFINDISN